MAAEKVTLARVAHFTKDKGGNPLKTKKGKPYTRCLIDTVDGRTMSGFGDQTTTNWNEGMEVEVEITESNGYLNFNVPKKGSIDSQALEMAIKTHIDRNFAALRADLKVIVDHLNVEAPKSTVGNTGVEYPTGEETDAQMPSPFDSVQEDEVF